MIVNVFDQYQLQLMAFENFDLVTTMVQQNRVVNSNFVNYNNNFF